MGLGSLLPLPAQAALSPPGAFGSSPGKAHECGVGAGAAAAASKGHVWPSRNAPWGWGNLSHRGASPSIHADRSPCCTPFRSACSARGHLSPTEGDAFGANAALPGCRYLTQRWLVAICTHLVASSMFFLVWSSVGSECCRHRYSAAALAGNSVSHTYPKSRAR